MDQPQRGNFENIAVHPYYRLFDPTIEDLSGGPSWPSFHERTFERHQRFGKPMDSEYESKSSPNLRLHGKYIWVGPIVGHFGHQLLDFSTRVAETATSNPNARYLVSTQISPSHPESQNPTNIWHYPTLADVPLHIRNILNWVGIPHENLTIINEPAIVDELEVIEQGEQFMIPPADWHLDALDEIMLQKVSISSEKIYVSRTKLGSRLGNILGERAIEAAFVRSGFKIIYPESLPVSVQARIYMGARLIVFAEGSAIHGLGLLGHIKANVVVIERRKNAFSSAVFACSITPRVPSFVGIRSVEATFPSGDHWRSLTILNPENLIDQLFDQGIEIKNYLKPSEYWASVEEDLEVILANELTDSRRIETLFPEIGLGAVEKFSEFKSIIRFIKRKEN